jgi:hypothetical protein
MLACCSIGMKLLSLHQEEKYKTIVDVLKSKIFSRKMCTIKLYLKLLFLEVAKQAPSMFWTSGTDFECEGYFGFCTTKRLLRDETKCVGLYPKLKGWEILTEALRWI